MTLLHILALVAVGAFFIAMIVWAFVLVVMLIIFLLSFLWNALIDYITGFRTKSNR
jgi:uncharacterized membrane protein required for colicin V production